MTYDAAVSYLYNLQKHGIKLGLETMTALIARLGRPGYPLSHLAHRRYEWERVDGRDECCHVAGRRTTGWDCIRRPTSSNSANASEWTAG